MKFTITPQHIRDGGAAAGFAIGCPVYLAMHAAGIDVVKIQSFAITYKWNGKVYRYRLTADEANWLSDLDDMLYKAWKSLIYMDSNYCYTFELDISMDKEIIL